MRKAYHLGTQEIPPGYQIFRDRVAVAGVTFRKEAAKAFCRGRNQQLSFEPDPSNRHDVNAIKVIGHWSGWLFSRRRIIGYVPAYYAAVLADTQLSTVVLPRLLKTYVGRGGFVEVMFQILGPSEELERFKSHTR